MNLLPIVLAIIASLFVFIGGLLYGIRSGKKERNRLNALVSDLKQNGGGDSQKLGALQNVIQDLSSRLSAQSTQFESALSNTANTLRKEVSSLGVKDQAWQLEVANQIDQLRVSQKSELQSILQPLKRDQARSALLQNKVESVLAPIARTQSVRSALEALKIKGLTRNDLPSLLTTISQQCGLTTCVLVDPSGLPIAANDDAANIDVLSGLSAFLYRLAQNTKKNGRPMPNAFLNRDEQNQLTLARLVPIEDDIFTILAVMQGGTVGPDILDPLVPIIRKVLQNEPWA